MRPSFEIVHDSASPGTIWVLSSGKVTSVSTMRRPTRLELRSVTWAGSRSTGSATSPTTSVLGDCAGRLGAPVVSITASARVAHDQIRLRLIAPFLLCHRPPAWRAERGEYITGRRGLDIASART